MRRGLRTLLTVATTAVLAVAFRSSLHGHPAPTAEAPVPTQQTPARAARRPRETSRARRTTATPTPTPTTKPTTPARVQTPTQRAAVVEAGPVVDTPYGPVQVEVTVRAGRIVKARALQHPSGDGETDQINGYAVPQLDQETLAAQSAHIDTVSGATFTSDGYQQSLQSALDAAHRAGAR